jgi:hypothetical protein
VADCVPGAGGANAQCTPSAWLTPPPPPSPPSPPSSPAPATGDSLAAAPGDPPASVLLAERSAFEHRRQSTSLFGTLPPRKHAAPVQRRMSREGSKTTALVVGSGTSDAVDGFVGRRLDGALVDTSCDFGFGLSCSAVCTPFAGGERTPGGSVIVAVAASLPSNTFTVDITGTSFAPPLLAVCGAGDVSQYTSSDASTPTASHARPPLIGVVSGKGNARLILQHITILTVIVASRTRHVCACRLLSSSFALSSLNAGGRCSSRAWAPSRPRTG